MKTFKLSFFLVLITVSKLAMAQGFHLGAKVGANIFRLDGQSFKEQFTVGYNLGGFAEIGLNNKWTIQPELLWNQTNTKTSTEFSDIYPTGTELKSVKLNYITIPVLLNYRPIKLLSLQAGPQFGILTSQTTNLVGNVREAFKKGDFALLGGVQINLLKVKVGARYQIGLTNINDIDDKDKWRNEGFQIYAGLRIF